jgi:hypothetical protein
MTEARLWRHALAVGNSLMSETRRKEYMARFQQHHTEERKDQMRRVAQQMLKTRKKQGSKQKWSLELRNKNGNCPDQILDKISQLEQRLATVPTSADFIAAYGHGNMGSLRYHYGNWTKAMRALGKSTVSDARVLDPLALLARINEFRFREGREPLWSDFRHSSPLGAPNSYIRKFGGIREARKQADALKLAGVQS